MATREERLDALVDAVVEWADAETRRFEDERDFLTSVLQGRTGTGQLSSHILATASVFTQDEVNDFLTE